MNDSLGEGVEGRTLGLAMPGAGMGVRMGGVRKPFLELQGRSVLYHALRPFLEHPSFHAFVIALSPEDVNDPPGWLRNLDPRVSLVPGGASRGESVWAALQELPRTVDFVAIHDAARPLVTRAVIDRCLEASDRERGAVAGWPAVDTLKRVAPQGRIVETLSREEIWCAQTPQVFPREMITEAYRKALAHGVRGTDDSALVERLGGEVVMVRGSAANLKVTRPEDLLLAATLLGEGEGEGEGEGR